MKPNKRPKKLAPVDLVREESAKYADDWHKAKCLAREDSLALVPVSLYRWQIIRRYAYSRYGEDEVAVARYRVLPGRFTLGAAIERLRKIRRGEISGETEEEDPDK